MRWAMASTIGGGQQNHSHSCEFKITGGNRMNQALEMARVAYQALDEKYLGYLSLEIILL